MENWIRNQDSFYVTKDDQKISFSDDFIKSEERTTGLGKGIYSTYKYFDTYIWKEDSTNHYYFEWIPKVDENIKEVHFPDSFVCEDKDGYSTIPYMQGLLIPNRYEYDYSRIAFDGQFTSCAAYMPWLSQTNKGLGYIAINETPWDSKYTINHDDKGTRLQFVWLTSLGKMRYKRVVRYSFESNMDYNRACKIYREYVKETGLFKSLKEKEVTLSKISDLQQCAVVHTGIKAHTEKDSRFYNGQEDVIHSFDSVKEMIQSLHELGSHKLYLHLDGWGDPGYDNCHPDFIRRLQDSTDLLRKTIIEIVFKSGRLKEFYENPEEWIKQVSKILLSVKKENLTEGIKYEKVDDYYEQDFIFNDEELYGYKDRNILDVSSDKNIYDHVIYDSEIEREFAIDAENDDDVLLYAKLPSRFKIDTPIGNYNPDWAVVLNTFEGEKLYFVAETKGTENINDLKGSEKKKILCGRKHFEVIDTGIKYEVVKELKSLKDRS